MPRHIPRTHDEITRSTVIDPDGSFRPPANLARATDPMLCHRVEAALLELGTDISFEVSGSAVSLRGVARDLATSRRIEHAVLSIEGVEDVWNHLRID